MCGRDWSSDVCSSDLPNNPSDNQSWPIMGRADNSSSQKIEASIAWVQRRTSNHCFHVSGAFRKPEAFKHFLFHKLLWQMLQASAPNQASFYVSIAVRSQLGSWRRNIVIGYPHISHHHVKYVYVCVCMCMCMYVCVIMYLLHKCYAYWETLYDDVGDSTASITLAQFYHGNGSAPSSPLCNGYLCRNARMAGPVDISVEGLPHARKNSNEWTN